MYNREGFPEDFNEKIARLSELAGALTQDFKSADMAGGAALFRLLDYYESLSNSDLKHTEIVAIVAKALSNKKLRLADEKTAILDDNERSLLSRTFHNNYPLSLIGVVLEQPEAKSLVHFNAKKELETAPLISLLLTLRRPEFLAGPEEKKQHIEQWTQCISTYLSHIEHPWQELSKQSMHCRREAIDFFDDQILNLLIEKIGPFPWHEETSFSFIKHRKTFSFTLPMAGIILLSRWLSCKNISIKSLEKFIGEKPVEWSPLIKKLLLATKILSVENFFIHDDFLRREFDNDISDDQESKNKIKPRNRLNERLIFLLKKGIIKVTYDLLDKIYNKKDDLLKECLSFLTPQSLCEDPENAIKILLVLIKNQYPLAQIKNLIPKDIKETTSLLNFPVRNRLEPHKKFTLLEDVIYAKSWRGNDAPILVQFLLDHGCQVTGKAIINCRHYSPIITLLMDHLRKAKLAWYQQPQQGYEILLAMIETEQPIEEIQYYLQLEDKDTSGVLNYVSPDGLTTFSNLLDAVQYNGKYYSKLVKILIQSGAIITGESLGFLLRFHPDLARDSLAGCNFKEICKKPPRHGAELISCIIRNLDDPIKQLQPWLESKEEKAVSAILAYDMSETSPLSQFLAKIDEPINKAQSDFILLLLHKGAIPSGPDLIFLTSNMKEVFVPVMLDNLNLQHLFAHSPGEISALLAATISLGWPCASVEKLLDFKDSETLAKVVNSNESRLLPTILQTWNEKNKDRMLQIIQLLVHKGYRLNEFDLKNLKSIPLKHHSLIWAALDRAPFEYESIDDNIILDLVDMQAPIERVQRLLPISEDHEELFYRIVDSLDAENCAYRLTVILSLSINRPDHHYLNLILEKLVEHYLTTQDVIFKKVIAVIHASFFSAPAPLLSLYYINLRDFLIERSQFHLITADYFSQAEILLREKTAFFLPTMIVNIIWNYILPSELAKLLLDSAQVPAPIDKDEKFSFSFTELPVIKQQAELGFCAAHAAFNAQLTRSMRWVNQPQLQDFFSKDSKDHPLTQLTQFFLEKSHETKQGEEDGTPVHMRQLLRKQSLTAEITIVPMTESKEGLLSIGHGDSTLSLEMFKNLLPLHQQFLSGKRVSHSFVISFNNVHWLAASWIGKQSKKNVWLGMDSNPVTHPALTKKICQLLQELITEKNLLKKMGRGILLQGNQELKSLLRGIDSAQVLLCYLNPIQALLEVYAELAKSSGSLQRLLDEDQCSQFQQITVLIKKFMTPEIENDLAICMEIIKKLETSPLLVQKPSSASILAAPGGPGLLASPVSSAAAPVAQPAPLGMS